MPQTLAEVITEEIRRNGPMDVGRFMSMALGHAHLGYYNTRDPLGARGDFVTAPEVSQMFGEMIGAMMVEVWRQMGAPARFHLIECGPGRGTLMADIMRTLRALERGMEQGTQIHLLEMSPVLKLRQGQALEGYAPIWHKDVQGLPVDAPWIAIGNEFLDALPVRQWVRTQEGWCERMVSLDSRGAFFFQAYGPKPPEGALPDFAQECEIGAMIETAPERLRFMREFLDRQAVAGGFSLWVDYGYTRPGPGDTLQAVAAHRFASVLDAPGQADITAHVDFASLAALAGEDVRVFGPAEQGPFLMRLGIAERAQKLLASASAEQAQELRTGLARLTDAEKMGALFKMIGFAAGAPARDEAFHAPGF